MVDILLNLVIKVQQLKAYDPIGITIDTSGNVYVADGKDTDIHVYSPVK